MEGMDGETCLRQAYDAIFHGDFESARHWFGLAVESEPDNASYHYKASITCARSGKMDLAETYARRAVELDPDDPVYALNLQTVESKRLIGEARGLLEQPVPDAAGARACLVQAEELDPLSAEAKLLLGLTSRMFGDFRSAIAYASEALSLEPQYEDAARLIRQWKAERRKMLSSPFSPLHPKRNR